jgi:osmotically-inducible protein OsmY
MAITTTTPRADAAILAEARQALHDRRSVPGGVRVRVERGVLTLAGTVHLPFERAEGEDAVRTIDGIHPILNHIVVTEAPIPLGFEPPDEIC